MSSMDERIEGCSEKLLEVFADRKVKENIARHSLGHFTLSLDPDLALSAQYSNYFQKDKKPRKMLVQRSDNSIVKRERLETT
uniref:Uncharacterized protein n=1 Tax=Glossina morsitans morsitans TaxID=37546 RepID=A0A1B0G0R5_GLOMM